MDRNYEIYNYLNLINRRFSKKSCAKCFSKREIKIQFNFKIFGKIPIKIKLFFCNFIENLWN